MRLGIFGGSFDPVHYGHLLLAEYCRGECHLDELWFMPAATPPHKQGQSRASAEQRVEMLRLAIGGDTRMSVSTLEIDREGVSYTVDTLEAIHREKPDAELFLALGADSLVDLPHWRAPKRICELATLVVALRHGTENVDFAEIDSAAPGAKHLVVSMPRIELSSRDIRRRVAEGLSIRYQTPRAVEKYIETHGLYRSRAD